MSGYPDGMTGRDWDYIDGNDGGDCEVDDCVCKMTQEDIELEKAGL